MQILEEIVLKCLIVCDSKKASTIAFPALGAGILKYPPKVVAKIMVATVQNYYETHRTTCIKEVKFVLYMECTYKEFEYILSQPLFVDSSAPKRAIAPGIDSDHSISVPLTTTMLIATDLTTPSREGSVISSGNSNSNVKAPIKICKGRLLKEKVYYYSYCRKFLLECSIFILSILVCSKVIVTQARTLYTHNY